MLCFEDILDSLNWVKNIGGVDKTIDISKLNLQMVENKISNSSWLEFLPSNKDIRSCTSICLKVNPKVIELYGEETLKEKMKIMFNYFESEDIAYDINSYRDAPLGVRVWGGATVNKKDIDILLDWLEWGFINYIKS